MLIVLPQLLPDGPAYRNELFGVEPAEFGVEPADAVALRPSAFPEHREGHTAPSARVVIVGSPNSFHSFTVTTLDVKRHM